MDFEIVGSFKKAVVLEQTGFRADRLFDGRLHLSLHAFDLVMQMPLRTPERLTESEVEIGVALISAGRVRNIDFLPSRKLQPNCDFEQ
jgi:hypothetical protein